MFCIRKCQIKSLGETFSKHAEWQYPSKTCYWMACILSGRSWISINTFVFTRNDRNSEHSKPWCRHLWWFELSTCPVRMGFRLTQGTGWTQCSHNSTVHVSRLSEKGKIWQNMAKQSQFNIMWLNFHEVSKFWPHEMPFDTRQQWKQNYLLKASRPHINRYTVTLAWSTRSCWASSTHSAEEEQQASHQPGQWTSKACQEIQRASGFSILHHHIHLSRAPS